MSEGGKPGGRRALISSHSVNERCTMRVDCMMVMWTYNGSPLRIPDMICDAKVVEMLGCMVAQWGPRGEVGS